MIRPRWEFDSDHFFERDEFRVVSRRYTKMQREIISKVWQAIMDYLVQLPDKNRDSFSVLPMNDRAKESRASRI